MTHDPHVAAQAERIVEIRDGEIVRNLPASRQGGGIMRARPQAEPSAVAGSVYQRLSRSAGDGLASDGGE
ncbi:hypothetical protein MJ390_10710 [Klebsiella pneumoniae]|nr:hypothetical protein MJ390_10710 [Klebsiella pneumoniae]